MRETIRRCAIIIACSAVLLGIAPRDGETLLYVFNGSGDGAFPYGGLLADAGGSLYGTTFGGGKFFAGTAFELAKSGSGGYVERVLHSFRGRKDGAGPQAALIADSAGALYGTTAFGGVGCPDRYGCGTVFRLTTHDTTTRNGCSIRSRVVSTVRIPRVPSWPMLPATYTERPRAEAAAPSVRPAAEPSLSFRVSAVRTLKASCTRSKAEPMVRIPWVG